MVLPALNYQPQQIEDQRVADAKKVLAGYGQTRNAGIAQVATASPYYATPALAGKAPQTVAQPAVAQANKGLADTTAMWNRYNAGVPQRVQDWITAIDQAGAEQRMYWKAKVEQEARDNAAARARMGGGGRGGGGGRRGGGGGGGRRRGGGGGRKAAATGGYYAQGVPASSFDQWLSQHGLGASSAPIAPPTYSAPTYQSPEETSALAHRLALLQSGNYATPGPH